MISGDPRGENHTYESLFQMRKRLLQSRKKYKHSGIFLSDDFVITQSLPRAECLWAFAPGAMIVLPYKRKQTAVRAYCSLLTSTFARRS